ncbi:MAG: RraA family protein [Candidatus Methanomethylicia archaeon]
MLSEDLRKILYGIPTATLSDVLDTMGFQGCMSYDIRPIVEGKIVGPALTVSIKKSTIRETPLKTLQLIDEATPGSIIVIGANGYDARDASLLGGLMATAAKTRGVEGFVLDGGVRDVDEIKSLKLPVYARSIIPATIIGRFIVEDVNKPIVCSGVQVKPGDIVVGDYDGVVVIPIEILSKVIEKAIEIDRIEKLEAEELKQGKSIIETIKKYTRI